MHIIYNGKAEETSATSVAAFLVRKGVTKNAIVEYRGEILDAAALDSVLLEDGAELNVYRIVAGG